MVRIFFFSLICQLSFCLAPLRAEDLGEMAERLQLREREYPTIDIPGELVQGKIQNDDAQKMTEHINSEEFQAKLDKERVRIKQELFGATPTVEAGYYGDASKSKKNNFGHDERVYIFVSSSVPEGTLRAYARDIENLGSPNVFMVMRGMVGGMKEFGPTMNFLSKVLMKESNCRGKNCQAFGAAVEIDPLLFRRYKPTKVPAIVYAKGIKLQDPEHSEGDIDNSSELNSNSWWMVYGDSSLGYALDQIGLAANIRKLQDMAISLNQQER